MKRKSDKPQPFCWDCVYAKPFDVQWNRAPDGTPLTKHCYADPEHIKMGIMKKTIACKLFKKKELI